MKPGPTIEMARRLLATAKPDGPTALLLAMIPLENIRDAARLQDWPELAEKIDEAITHLLSIEATDSTKRQLFGLKMPEQW